MELKTSFDSVDAEIAYLRNKPFEAATPGEMGDLLQLCYNRLYGLTQKVTSQKKSSQILRTVSVLGRLTEPRVHQDHFRFESWRLRNLRQPAKLLKSLSN